MTRCLALRGWGKLRGWPELLPGHDDRMHYNDFAEVARPVVGAFGRLPKPGPRKSRTETKRATTSLF